MELLQLCLTGLAAYLTLTFSPLVVALPVMTIMPRKRKEAGNFLAEAFVRWVEQIFPDHFNQYITAPLTLPMGFWLIGLGHLVLLVMIILNLSRDRGADACEWVKDLLSPT